MGSAQRRRRRRAREHGAVMWAAAAAASATLCAGSLLRAANRYWDTNGPTAGSSSGSTAPGTWSNSAATWNSDPTGVLATTSWTSGDTAVFAAGTNAIGAYTVTMASSQTVVASGITVEEGQVFISPSAGSVLQSPSSGSSNFTIDVASLSSLVITQPLSAYPVTKNGLGTLSIGTIIFPPGPPAASLLLNAGTLLGGAPAIINSLAGATVQFDNSSGGTIGNNQIILGGGGVSKTGTGVYSLAGTLQYTGPTTISAGTLLFDANTGGNMAQQGATPVTISAGATLQLNNSASETIGSLSGTGQLALSLGVLTTGTDNTSTTYSGAILGNGSLVKVGTGTWRLNGGNNTFTGGLAINGGAVSIASSARLGLGPVTFGGGTLSTTAAFSIANSVSLGTGATFDIGTSNVTFAGTVSGAGTLTKIGAGAAVLPGPNAYSGKVVINAGTLSYTGGNALGAEPNSVRPDSFTINGGTLQLGFTSTANPSTSFSSSNRGITIGASGGTIDVTTGNAVSNFGGINGNGTLTKTGAGSFNLRATNAFTGKFVVTGGTLDFNNTTVFGGGSGPDIITLNGGTLAESLSIGATSIGSSTGITVSAASAILTPNSNQNVTINSAITGAGALTKSGLGTVTLAGTSPNTNSAVTTVSGGTLALAKPDNVNAVGGDVTVNTSGTLFWQANEQISNSATLTLNSGGTLDLNGKTETLGSFIDNGGTTILGGGHLLTGSDLSLTDGTVIGSDSTVARDVVYTGANSAATVSGNISLTNANSNHNFDINNGAADPDVIISGAISGSTNIIKIGAGTLRLSGNNSGFSGHLNVLAGTLNIAGGTLDSSSGETIASTGTASVVQSGGTHSIVGSEFHLAEQAGSSGSYVLSGGTLSVSSVELVGVAGAGSFTQFAGSHNSAALTLGQQGSGSGTYNLFGGTVTTGNINIGLDGQGTLAISGGAHVSSVGGSIATDSGSVGSVTVSGVGTGFDADSPGNDDFNVGQNGNGTLTIQLGASFSHHHGTAFVGRAKGSNGHVVIDGNGSSFTSDALILGGNEGSGATAQAIFDISNAAQVNVAGNALIGNGGHGVLNVATAGVFHANNLLVGAAPAGFGELALTTADAAVQVNSNLILGFLAPGTVTMTGGTLGVGGDETIGTSAAATHAQSGGVTTIAGNLLLGSAVGGSGTLTLTTTGTVSAANVYVGGSSGGAAGVGIVNVNAGAMLSTPGTLRIWDSDPATKVNLAGGTLSVGTIDTDGVPANFNWTAGTLSVQSPFTIDNLGPLGGNLTVGSGKTLSTGNQFTVGATAAGTMTVSGGGTVVSAAPAGLGVVIGNQANGSVTVDGAGSSWNITASKVGIGNLSTGSLSVTNGAAVSVDASVELGRNSDSSGSIAVSGPASQLFISGGLILGGSDVTAGGIGTLTIDNSATVTANGGMKLWNNFNLCNIGGGSSGAGTVLSLSYADLGNGKIQSTASPGAATVIIGTGGIITSGGGIIFSNPSFKVQLGGDVTVNSYPAAGAPGFAANFDLLGGNRTFNVIDGSDAIDLAVSGALSNGGIIKSGAGTLQLSGANSYGGVTSIQGGTLRAEASALPSGTAVSIGSSATLSLNGNNTIASLAGTSATAAVALNGFALTVGDNTDTTYAGTINGGGSGALIKQGSGALTLGSGVTGAAITVNLGTLRLASSNLLLSGTVTVTGTGPTSGTLALPADNLGSASLSLPGGRVLFENSMSLTRSIVLDVGGGTLEVTPANTVEINSVLAGSGGLTKTGSGTLGLGCANTYMGQTFISAGTLATRVADAIPAESEVTVAAGANLSLDSHNAHLGSIAGGGTISIGTATLTVGGNDAAADFSGALNGSGAGAVVKQGLGTLTLSGSMNFGGGLTVNNGEITITGMNNASGGIAVSAGGRVTVGAAAKLGAASNVVTLSGGSGTLATSGNFQSPNPITLGSGGGGTIEVADKTTLTQAGAITGNSTLTKSGPGTLQLQSSQAPSGAVVISAGKLALIEGGALTSASSFQVRNGASLELNNSTGNSTNRIAAGVTLSGGTFSFIGAAGVSSTESAGTLTLAGGASSIVLQQGASGGTTAVTFSSLATQSGATLDVTAPGAGATNALLITSQSAGFLGGGVTISGGDFARYDTDLGVVPITAYSSSFSAGADVRLNDNTSAPAGISIRSLILNSSANSVTVTQSGTTNISSGGLLKLGANTATITGGGVTSDGGNLYLNTAGGDVTIAAAVSGPMNLVKSGAGLVALTNNNNSFTGGIYLDAGTLRITGASQLGNSANDLIFNGGTLQTTQTITLTSGRDLTFNAAGGGGTVEVASGTLSLPTDSQITAAGSGPMTKAGSGTLSIGGNNNYRGDVTVSAGTLLLANPAALGGAGPKSRITLAPLATLDLRSDGPYPVNFGNDVLVLDNNAATAATINTNTINNSPATAGTFRLGALRIGNAQLNTGGAGGNLEFTGIVTVTGNASFNTTRDLTFSDRVTGAGSINKLGSATLTFGSGPDDTKANTYAGLTTIAGGTLRLNKAAGTTAIPGDISMSGGTLILLQPRQIADNSALILGGGTFDINGKDDAVTSLVNNGASVIVKGATLTVKNTTIAGGTTVIGNPPSGPPVPPPQQLHPGGPVEHSAGLELADSVLSSNSMTVSDGSVTVNPGGVMAVGADGLVFNGSASPTITLISSANNPGKITLGGDVTNTCTSGTASIVNSGAIPIAGWDPLESTCRHASLSIL